MDELEDDATEQVIVKASIESCSGAAHLAEELIERAGWMVTLGHPGIVRFRAQKVKQRTQVKLRLRGLLRDRLTPDW